MNDWQKKCRSEGREKMNAEQKAYILDKQICQR